MWLRFYGREAFYLEERYMKSRASTHPVAFSALANSFAGVHGANYYTTDSDCRYLTLPPTCTPYRNSASQSAPYPKIDVLKILLTHFYNPPLSAGNNIIRSKFREFDP